MKHIKGIKTASSAERLKFVFQIILIFESLMQLTQSNAYFQPYLLVYLLGILSYIYIYRSDCTGVTCSARDVKIGSISALLFTILISTANYPIWLEPSLGANTPAYMRFGYGFVKLMLLSCGCFLVFRSIFFFAALRMDFITWKRTDAADTRMWKPKKLFCISFFSIASVYLSVLYLIKYPGLVKPDMIAQFTECITGVYSNWNPFFSTLRVRPFVAIGMALFHELNACAAMYFTVQAIFAAFTFACVVETMTEMKAPKWLIICTILYYALMPYHIMHSIGDSKNVQFSASVTLFCLILYRLLKQPNLSKKWYVFLFLISVCFCVLRNNGILAFLFFIPVFYFTFRLQNKRILLTLISAVLVSFALTRPVLHALGIPQADWVENLSLPTQQVARVVIDHDDLTDKELEMLNPIMDAEMIPCCYDAGNSDPIKYVIRDTIAKNLTDTRQKLDFLKLWVQLGLRHPVTYVKAFVDLTCGYWNSGYYGSPWTNFIIQNDLGLHLTNRFPVFTMLFDRYIGLFDDIMVLQLMVCTGFFVWMYLCACIICIIRKDKLGAILCAPVLCVVQTLLLGVPVVCDLCYIYCAFCGLPFILAVSTRRIPD